VTQGPREFGAILAIKKENLSSQSFAADDKSDYLSMR
jgi:hypothetical protein